MQAAREAARRSQCTNNLKQLGLGLHNFHDTYKHFPIGEYNNDLRNWGWGTFILPFVEQKPLYDLMTKQDNTNGGVYCPPNMGGGQVPGGNIDNYNGVSNGYTDNVKNSTGNAAATTVLAGYVCPSDILPRQASNQYAKSNYCANMGSWLGAWDCGNNGSTSAGTKQTGFMVISNCDTDTYVTGFADITDGSSNTVALGEATVSQNASPATTDQPCFPIWAGGNPNNAGCGNRHGVGSVFRWMDSAAGFYLNRRVNDESNVSFGSQHPGGGNFLMADGSCKFVSENIDAVTYRAVGTRNGGESVALP